VQSRGEVRPALIERALERRRRCAAGCVQPDDPCQLEIVEVEIVGDAAAGLKRFGMLLRTPRLERKLSGTSGVPSAGRAMLLRCAVLRPILRERLLRAVAVVPGEFRDVCHRHRMLQRPVRPR
jgi:hypothetical protein